MVRCKKDKNRSKSVGQAGSVGNDGGASGSGVGREVGGRGIGAVGAGVDLEDVDIIDIDPHTLTSVATQGRIREGWLQQCTRESVQEWGPYLPHLDVGEVVGKVVPASAKSYNDLAPGKGVVLVEVSDPAEGVIGQLQAAKATVLEKEASHSELVTLLKKCQEDNLQAISQARREIEEVFRWEVERTRAEIVATQVEVVELKRQVVELNHRYADCESHLQSMTALLKKGVELSNKVKLRVTLSLARRAMEVALGRMKGPETWSDYVKEVAIDDWQRIGVERGLVTRLLADGAYAFNDFIHKIPAEEVVGSIAWMPLGSLRTAWEEIFFMAFGKRVTDELFREELDYAAEQTRVLQFLLTYSARARSGSLGQRMTALAAMGELGDYRAWPVLLEGLRDMNSLVVEQPEKAMWKIFMRFGREDIDQMLQDGDELLMTKDGYKKAKRTLTELLLTLKRC